MFQYNEVIRRLDKIDDMNQRKARRYLFELVTSDDFLKWVYMPSDEKPLTMQQFNEFNSYLISARSMELLAEAVEDEDYNIERSVACYLHTVAETAVDAYNAQDQMLAEDRKNRSISNSNARDIEEKLENYRHCINGLTRAARKSLRMKVRQLNRDSGLPKSICRLGYFIVPAPKYLSRNRVGAFLRELLRQIYDSVAQEGFVSNPHAVNWNAYFNEIFGKQNVYSVATFILLEGCNRIDKYRGKDAYEEVAECWDSLTDYALDCLNEAPDEIRNQMIELYIKRIDRQFRNKNVDLRVDLTSLSGRWNKLRKTMERYTDRIQEIMNRAIKDTSN